jgi:hypothetical protein
MRRAWTLFLCALAATVAAELFIAPQPHFEFERLFAFHALYGFAACAALILLARALGFFLKRRDDYYGD